MEPEDAPLLQVCELSISYAGASGLTCAVDGVSFSIERGEAVGLLGASGAGKTSIALAILGLLPEPAVVSGSVRFDARELIGLSERQLETIRGARIGIIYQESELALNPVLSAGAQIVDVIRAHRTIDAAARRERAMTLLNETGFGEAASRIFASYPHQLSGGERQRILIAQALACDPDLVIADEPTASVDAAIQAEILGVLRQLRRRRRLACLFISHRPAVLASITDRLLVLSGGRIVEEGTVQRVLEKPVHPFTQRIVESMPCGPDGRAAGRAAPDEARGGLVEVCGLTKTYSRRRGLARARDTVTALAGASLTIPAESTLALVGASGSGKSTLARCVARLEDPDSGEIRFRGIDVARLDDLGLRRYRRAVQLILQDPAGALNPRFSAEAIVAEPLVVQGIGTPRERRARARELLAEVGLPPARAGDRPASFSGGQRQRLAIARALALGPSFLILDEAFSGVDLPVQRQILDLLARLREKRALTCLLISHDLALVSRIADRIAVMHEGRIVECAGARELCRSPAHPQTRILLSAALVSPGRDPVGAIHG
jgi:peptide/nickel transport system ATP-binding protein